MTQSCNPADESGDPADDVSLTDEEKGIYDEADADEVHEYRGGDDA